MRRGLYYVATFLLGFGLGTAAANFAHTMVKQELRIICDVRPTFEIPPDWNKEKTPRSL